MISRTMSRTALLAMLFLSVASFCIESAHAQVVFEDTEFVDNWNAMILSPIPQPMFLE